MRRTTKSSVPLALLLLVAGCGSASKATSQSGAPGKPSTTAGLTLAFVAAQDCSSLVPVTGGFFGRCIIGYGAGRDPRSGLSLIRNDGTVVPFPGPNSLSSPYFLDGAGDVVAEGTINPPAPVLFVVEPTSGAVKNAIPLPAPTPRLIGVTGTTAILAHSTSSNDNRVIAYDLSGTKKWDVPFPDFVKPMQVEITPAGVLVFEYGVDRPVPPATHATMLRLDDGSALWAGSGEGLSVAPERVGQTVFYDNAGVPRSLATGAPTGPGASPSSSAGVAYQDDLIITDPLRRITPRGETIWTQKGTPGTPATDGKTLVVLGTEDLFALDPATGRRLGQAPDPSPNIPSCGTNYLFVASPLVVLDHQCNQAGTAVYTFKP